MTGSEWVGWRRYLAAEPLPIERLELAIGINTSTLANVNRSKKSTAYKPQDFMPDYRTAAEKEAARVKQAEANTQAELARQAFEKRATEMRKAKK